ncbi:MAG: indolepyruvate oxidoreductase subunit beta [Synergistaceae bacterium]|nr:indolepyruvate oxidoreductase subunit beta [Synergistaceae bacterium]
MRPCASAAGSANSFASSKLSSQPQRRPSNMTKNIMIVGVGGQGSVLASKLLGHLLTAQGFDVKVSEVHGMSQRGGSVVTYVRYGERVYSPIIDKGEADFIVSFEILETARWLEYLKPDGQIVTSTQQIDPMPVLIGAMPYPDNLLDKIKATGVKVDALDCLKLAEEAGSSKAVNLVLLGRLSHYFNDIADEAWQEAINSCVPPKFIELNKKAFELGKNS